MSAGPGLIGERLHAAKAGATVPAASDTVGTRSGIRACGTAITGQGSASSRAADVPGPIGIAGSPAEIGAATSSGIPSTWRGSRPSRPTAKGNVARPGAAPPSGGARRLEHGARRRAVGGGFGHGTSSSSAICTPRGGVGRAAPRRSPP